MAREERGEEPDGETLDGRPRWRVAALAGLGVLVVLAVLALRPGGPILADRTEHVELDRVFGPLTEDAEVVQPFLAGDDGLSAVSARFGTAGGVSRCAIEVIVRHATRVVHEGRLECADVPESAVIGVAAFAPEEGSGGRRYELALRLAPGSVESVTVWGGADQAGRLPGAVVDGEEQPASLEIHTGYGGGGFAAGLLGTALERMDRGLPGWQSPLIVVLAAVVALGGLVALTVVRGRRVVLLLVVVIVAKGFVWAALIPPLETPDELAHVAYAQFMAEAHRIPKRHVAQLGVANFYSEQLTSIAEARHTFASAPGDRVDDDDLPGAGLSPVANGDGAATGYPPHYYVVPAMIYEVAPGRVDEKAQAMRLWSVALGGALGVVCLAIGRRLFSRESAAVALAVAVTWQPMMSQQSAAVNGDALVALAGASCLLACLELLRPYPERRRWTTLAGAAAFGVSLLAKLFAAALGPLLLIAWLLGRWRTDPAERPRLRDQVGQAAAGFGATYGTWFLFAAVFGYEGPSVSDLPEAEDKLGPLDYLHLIRRDGFRELYATWVDQLWGNFSWLDTPLPDGVHQVVLVALLAGVAVTATWSALRLRGLVRNAERRRLLAVDAFAHPAILLLAVLGALGVLYTTSYLTFTRTAKVELVQGRYALMVLPAVLALVPLELGSFAGEARRAIVAARAMVVVAGAMVVLGIGSVALLLERFYL